MFWGASNLAQNVTGIQVTKSLEHSETDPFTMGSFDPYDLTHHGETFQGLRGHMYARVKELRWRWYIIYSIYATLCVWKYDKIWNNAMWIHISMAKNLGSHHTTSRWYGASSILQILSTESSKVLVPATSIVLGRFVSIVGSIAELVGCSHTAVCCWLFIFHHHSNSNTNNKVRLPQGIKKKMYLQGWFLVHNTLKITSARILCMELVGADLLFLLRSWPNPGKKSKSSEAPMLNETCWGRLGKHLGEYFVRMSFLLLTCGLYGGSIFPACAGVDMVLCET